MLVYCAARFIVLRPFMLRTCLLAVGLFVASPFAGGLPAHGQLLSPITGLFDTVNSLALFVQGQPQWASNASDLRFRNNVLRGIGTEVYLDLPSRGNVGLELALGTYFLQGFTDRSETLDLRGAVRAFPSVGVYATYTQGALYPYVGLNFGFLDFFNTKAYGMDGTQYDFDGETYELGLSAGLSVDTPGLDGLYVEASLRLREFANVDYGLAQVPDDWPRSIRLNGVMVSVGWQFGIQDTPRPASRPAFVGAWVVEEANGQAVPTVIEQTRMDGAPVRTELLGGTLVVHADTSYVLTLEERTTMLGLSLRPLEVSRPVYRSFGGSYGPFDGGLLLTPAEGEPFSVYRDGDLLTFVHPATGLRLVLRKAKR